MLIVSVATIGTFIKIACCITNNPQGIDAFRGMAEKIELILRDDKIRKVITYNAKENMKNMTPDAVGKQICNVLDEINKQNN